MNATALRVERPMNFLDAADRVGRDPRLVREARPARAVPQPGDVRRLSSAASSRPCIGIGAALGRVASEGHPVFVLAISAWLWFTVLFANFAEAVAEGRGKAQAATLRSMRQHVHAKKLSDRATARRRQTVEAERAATRRSRARRGQRHHSRRTARSSKASRRSTRARSRASPRPCCARRAATSRRSPAARACCPTGSSCASRAARARASSTA